MKKYMKSFFLFFALCLSLCFIAGCSGEEEIKSDGYSKDEILDKYEGISNSYNSDKPIDSGASVLGVGFSEVDLTFTSSDDTLAFSLDKNSFVKMALGGTFYNYINPGSELTTFDAGYKTARGISLVNKAGDILTTYGIADENAIFIKPGDTIYYNPTLGKFSGKLTALYAMEEDASVYKLLKSKDIEKFVYLRPTDSAYMNTEAIMSKFPSYTSLVSIDITADEEGNVSEIVFYRFDK
jgi:hypothetical protein